jgi:hypothetical protein
LQSAVASKVAFDALGCERPAAVVGVTNGAAQLVLIGVRVWKPGKQRLQAPQRAVGGRAALLRHTAARVALSK